MTKKTKPKTPSTASSKEYAQHRGVTASAVTKWKQKRLLVLKNGRIDVAASDAVLDRMEQSFEDGHEPANFNEAIFMKELYLAKLRRLEFHLKAGELLELVTVKSTLTDIFAQHKDGLLTIPERLSAPLAVETDAAKIRALLITEITGHLNGLADSLEGK